MWSGLMSFSHQILALFFTIVIARLLTPADFGMVGLLAIFTACATTLQDGGLIWALANRTNVTKEQYSTIFWFNVSLSALLYVILYLAAPQIALYYHQPKLLWLSRLVFVGIFLSSFGIVQNAYLYKQLEVKERTIATISSQVISGVIGVIMAYNGFAYWGIATQGVLMILANVIILWIYSPFRPLLHFDVQFLKEILPQGVRFLVPNIFSIVSENVFSLVLGRRYHVKDVGNYTQAVRWNVSTYSIVLGMLRNVTQPVLVQVRQSPEDYLRIFRKLFRMAAFLIVPSLLFLSMVSLEFIQVLLTEKWLQSALILRILCIGGIVSTLNTMFTYFIMSLKRTTLYMYCGIGVSTVSILAAVIVSSWGVIALAYSNVIISIITFAFYYYFVRQTHSYTIKQLSDDLLPVLIFSIIDVILVYLTTNWIEQPLLRLIFRITLAAIIYVFSMSRVKFDSYIESKKYIVNILRRINHG